MTRNNFFSLTKLLALFSVFLNASSAFATGTQLEHLIRDSGETVYIIPQEQLPNYISHFGAEVITENNQKKLRLQGWIPLECRSQIRVRIGNEGESSIYDSHSHSYPIYVEGLAVTNADGSVTTPEQCFEAHPASQCNFSRTPSERNCMQVTDVFKFYNTRPTESGDVVLRIESSQINPETAAVLPATDISLTHFTSQAELDAQAREEDFQATCAAANEGDRDAISHLRDFTGMNSIANELERELNEQDFQQLLDTQVNNIDDAIALANALDDFAREHNDYRRKAADALLNLGKLVRDNLEIAEQDEIDTTQASSQKNLYRQVRRKLRVANNIFDMSLRLGNRSAQGEKDRTAIAQLRLEASQPNAEGSNYLSARRRVEHIARRSFQRAQREAAAGVTGSRPQTQLFYDSRDALLESDQTANNAWRHNLQAGAYNSSGSHSSYRNGMNIQYYYGYSPNTAVYAPVYYSTPYVPSYPMVCY